LEKANVRSGAVQTNVSVLEKSQSSRRTKGAESRRNKLSLKTSMNKGTAKSPGLPRANAKIKNSVSVSNIQSRSLAPKTPEIPKSKRQKLSKLAKGR